jgi:hypothetical protein
MVLEAMCDHNLYFWHHEFGSAGTLNDISIWDMSGLHKAFVDGTWSEEIDFPFTINGELFQQLWVTVDGIYPELARFVKTLSQPIGPEQARYAKWQERTRKDIERGFGVLQSKFRFLVQKVELWSIQDIVSLVNCSILLHNWMVTVRVSRNESESSDLYDLGDGSVNTGDVDANTGDGGANSGNGSANTGDGGANSGNGSANTGYGGANSGNGSANTGDGGATSGNGSANTGYGGANSGNGSANTGDGGNAGSDENILNATNNVVTSSDPANHRIQLLPAQTEQEIQRQRQLRQVRYDLVQERWSHLYDKVAYHRLQQAIINQLHINSSNF